MFRVRVYTSINTGNRAVTTLPLDKVNNHFSDRMKTASLGLLEVPVVRVNAGGDAPRTPPLLVTSRAIPPFFVFLQKVFWRISGKIFLARALRITRNHIKQMAGLVPLVCT